MADERDPIAPRREGPSWKRWAFGFALLVFAVFVIQNSQSVTVEFLFTEIETPLIFGLLFAGGLGALIGWAAPRVRRGGRDD